TPVRTLAGEKQVFNQLLRQRTRPLHPRALANKIAAARCPRLIPYGYRVGDFDATNTGAVCN
ncbi:hypothetical protein QU793_11150, partial [Escherichia coli]|nr:hypothetical protein [Escherichia coli]